MSEIKIDSLSIADYKMLYRLTLGKLITMDRRSFQFQETFDLTEKLNSQIEKMDKAWKNSDGHNFERG
jgi:hypothetical protein